MIYNYLSMEETKKINKTIRIGENAAKVLKKFTENIVKKANKSSETIKRFEKQWRANVYNRNNNT